MQPLIYPEKHSVMVHYFEHFRIVPQGLLIKQHRLRALEELMKEGMSAVASGICSNFAAQIFNKVADAFDMIYVEF